MEFGTATLPLYCEVYTLVAKIVETAWFFSSVTTLALNLSSYLLPFSYYFVVMHSLLVYKHSGGILT